MKKLQELLALAIQIAAVQHNGAVDKGGNPYILHPLWVMNQVRHLGIKYMIVAVLHDVVEDTDVTIFGLVQLGFPKEITQAIDLLTKRDNQSYEEYIEAIAKNDIARAVKLKDLEHNSRITRMKGLRTKDFERLQKYFTYYNYLKQF